MNFAHMEQYCPGAEFLGRALIRDFQFWIYSDGYATIVPKVGEIVWGGFWIINKQHLAELDKYEGVPQGCYYREVCKVSTCFENESELVRDAWIYFSTDTVRGTTRPGYMESVLEGACDCGLPEGYFPVLESWLASP